MQELNSCHQAMEDCSRTHTFAIAHLYQEEKTMDMHIHDCYEIYYSIQGGKQFLIDNRFYTIEPGTLFIINQYESHKITQADQMVHERIVLSIDPEYTKKLSTAATDLDKCFSNRPKGFSHKIALSKEQQARFLYYIQKITSASGYGSDITEMTSFMELMLLINLTVDSMQQTAQKEMAASMQPFSEASYVYNRQVDDILSYINANITCPLTTKQLADEFYLSESYICRIFKSATGTTMNKYIIARRISIAKSLLNSGSSVMEAYEACGFTDYSNFYKTFTKAVGIPPKKYARCSIS